MGYDDIDLARFITPQLTTMAVDKLGMGRLALTMLLHRLEFPGDGLVQAVVRTALVERGSVARRAVDDRRTRGYRGRRASERAPSRVAAVARLRPAARRGSRSGGRGRCR